MNEEVSLGLMIIILFVVLWNVILFNYWLNESTSQLAEKIRKIFGVYK